MIQRLWNVSLAIPAIIVVGMLWAIGLHTFAVGIIAVAAFAAYITKSSALGFGVTIVVGGLLLAKIGAFGAIG